MATNIGGGALVGSIDQGTASSRFLVFDESLTVVEKHQEEIKQVFPEEGWFEQDPEEIMASVRNCIEKVALSLQPLNLRRLQGIGVANQRETTIMWDKETGESLAPAIAWCDNRTVDIATKMIAKTSSKSKDALRSCCGLPIHPYFSALKIQWLMEKNEKVKTVIDRGCCFFGTVDSWIIWNLTGGVNGGVHVTDVTNASRTMLMNIHTLQWDPYLCKSSAEVYGKIFEGPLKGIPICGCLGDQQSSLVGQQCFKPGDARNTFGTGSSLFYNTGDELVTSQHGMLTTVAYKLGPNKPPVYALEGPVAVAGQSVRWLRDKMEFFSETSEIERVAGEVDSTGGVYFVPAFSGLYAPYWQPDARGIMIGLTDHTTKAHICRATLEAVCFQLKEVLDAMNQDCKMYQIRMLKVDGGMTNNTLLLQLQADLLGIPIVSPMFPEMTALGAAIVTGLAQGLWNDLLQLPSSPTVIFNPQITPEDCNHRYERWREAVRRSMHWEDKRKTVVETSKTKVALMFFGLGIATGCVVLAALVFCRGQ